MKKNYLLIGLTGSIAAGKSTVSHMLGDLGLPIIDADSLAKEITQKGKPAYQKIVEAFGPDILDMEEEIDRSQLRQIVFNDEAKRKELEAITHPEIKKLSEERIKEFVEAGARIIIYEASLLIEAGREKDMDGVLVVATSPNNQISRLLTRDETMTRELAESIINAQIPQEQKIEKATWVIDNNNDMVALEKNVRLWLETAREAYADAMGDSSDDSTGSVEN